MPAPDFPLPDDVPDLTIPERQRPDPPLVPAGAAAWRVGDWVLAPWEPNHLYAGTVSELKGNAALIEFDDGDVGWVALDRLQKLAIERGQKVRLRFESDQGEEWTVVAALRIPCSPHGPGAVPIRFASHLTFTNLQPGARVGLLDQQPSLRRDRGSPTGRGGACPLR